MLETGAESKERRSAGPDLSGLRFKTDVNEEELEREAKKVNDSELWRDL